MYNTEPKNNFKIHSNPDKKAYAYDISNYMKDIIGDVVYSAEIHLGYVFLEDSERDQRNDIAKFKDIARRIDDTFEKSKTIDLGNYNSIRIKFKNRKEIELSASDFGHLKAIL